MYGICTVFIIKHFFIGTQNYSEQKIVLIFKQRVKNYYSLRDMKIAAKNSPTMASIIKSL